jgi:two-component system sensor histidine kinase YesM
MRSIAATARRIFHNIYIGSTQRLANKLILLLTSIIILIVGSLTFISYKMLEQVSVENNITNTSKNLNLVNKNFEKYFAEMDQLTLPQFQYEQVLNALQNEAVDYSSQQYLQDYLWGMFYSRPDIVGIYLYVIEQHKYYYISHEDQDIKVRIKIDDSENISGRDWYRKAIDSKQNRYIQSLLVPADEGYRVSPARSFMAYHRTLRNLTDRKPKAVISFFFNASAMDEIAKDIPLGKGEHVVLMNEEEGPFYWDDREFYLGVRQSDFGRQFASSSGAGTEGRFTWTKENRKYFVMFNDIGEAHWKLIKWIPYAEIYEAAHTNRNVSYAIGLVFLIVAIILVTLTSNAITKPLKRLSRKMNRFGEGFFDVEAEVKGRDEIAHLSRQFNMMVTNTNDLIKERYKMKLVEKSAILKALEAEINPHFLYNALQAISTKALKNGMYDISDMVDALALTLRYCISGKDIVKLREELRHIEHYLMLQKARFGERLQIAYELDDGAFEIEIPKLSVQTLVENSINHVVEKVSYAVTITIKARKANLQTIIAVVDNGPGIVPERLDHILKSFQVEWEDREGESIGLKNVNTRLKLIYGEEARIDIRTGAEGTEMRMILPREEVNTDVQSADHR